ncbi:MAG: hypothetical protein MJ062_01295 [Oscillospiraceae bacterium]|nr:hypothetical protein [Oscillospiraceae bacterium]
MKRILSACIASLMAISSFSAWSGAAAETDSTLWEKFLCYDLCISNYNALTAEEKELCHFIFDTEQNAKDTVICERARRILAGDHPQNSKARLIDKFFKMRLNKSIEDTKKQKLGLS